jgi:hypothetical protein
MCIPIPVIPVRSGITKMQIYEYEKKEGVERPVCKALVGDDGWIEGEKREVWQAVENLGWWRGGSICRGHARSAGRRRHKRGVTVAKADHLGLDRQPFSLIQHRTLHTLSCPFHSTPFLCWTALLCTVAIKQAGKLVGTPSPALLSVDNWARYLQSPYQLSQHFHRRQWKLSNGELRERAARRSWPPLPSPHHHTHTHTHHT